MNCKHCHEQWKQKTSLDSLWTKGTFVTPLGMRHQELPLLVRKFMLLELVSVHLEPRHGLFSSCSREAPPPSPPCLRMEQRLLKVTKRPSTR